MVWPSIILIVLAILIGLIFLISDWAYRRMRGPSFLLKLRDWFFGTSRRAILAIETVLAIFLLALSLPALWYTGEYSKTLRLVVLVNALVWPSLVYLFVTVVYSKRMTGTVPGDELISLIEDRYNEKGQIEDVAEILLEKYEAPPEQTVSDEYLHAKRRLMERDDEVGTAFRTSLERWRTQRPRRS